MKILLIGIGIGIVLGIVIYSTLPSADRMNEVKVSVNVYLIEDLTGEFTTSRSEENVRFLFKEVNRIWKPAKISFVPVGIQRVTLDAEIIEFVINGGPIELPNSDTTRVKTFFVRHLYGSNGLAITQLDRTFVADVTTVNDYRATSHEFGHVLGLSHVDPEDRLMAGGKNGEQLTEEEIKIARKLALFQQR